MQVPPLRKLCDSCPFSRLRDFPCTLRLNPKCYSGEVWAIPKSLGDEEGYTEFKTSGLVHGTCQIASARRFLIAQEQIIIAKTNVWQGVTCRRQSNANLRSVNERLLITALVSCDSRKKWLERQGCASLRVWEEYGCIFVTLVNWGSILGNAAHGV